ncbi:hypothetical protein [uncultured Reyranella sp.]|jgi:hypothetical protein|uniref:hypothetical protein n=1 Tax=uncultured Reyranella sp. TaxID=735512 RepID=UPI00259CCBB9|nr:hypothetical protein [uncultured Reyranella sp.]
MVFVSPPVANDYPELRTLPPEDAEKIIAEAAIALHREQGLQFALDLQRGRLPYGSIALIIAAIALSFVAVRLSISHWWIWLTFPFVSYFYYKPRKRRELRPYVLAALDKYQGVVSQRPVTHDGRADAEPRAREAGL